MLCELEQLVLYVFVPGYGDAVALARAKKQGPEAGPCKVVGKRVERAFAYA
jgi:hypothetical protein